MNIEKICEKSQQDDLQMPHGSFVLCMYLGNGAHIGEKEMDVQGKNNNPDP